MAADMFLKLDGIDGESTDDSHVKWIEVESFSWGVTQSGTLAFGGGGGAGKAQFQDFHFVTNTSKASPLLFKSCATGEHIKEATLTVRKSGGDRPQDYLHIKMNDVLISSYQTGGSQGGGTPTDQASLNFAKIEFSYQPQKPDGSLDSAVLAKWDLKLNKAL